MPLPKPTPRKMLHLRDIQLRGYEREEGLIDIEAHMTDVKTYGATNGALHAGEPLYDMWLRVTLSQDLTIRSCEAAMDATPFTYCTGAAPNVERLVGLTVGKGFVKAAMQRIGGIEGCTHLRELLQPISTVAYQTATIYRRAAKQPGEPWINRSLLNTCRGYDENGDAVLGIPVQEASA